MIDVFEKDRLIGSVNVDRKEMCIMFRDNQIVGEWMNLEILAKIQGIMFDILLRGDIIVG